LGGDVDGPPVGVAVGHEHDVGDVGGVEHRHDVALVLGPGVCGDGRRPAGPAVAAAVEGDHPIVPGEVWNECLPDPGVGDRGRRDEQQGRITAAVDLVVNGDAVA